MSATAPIPETPSAATGTFERVRRTLNTLVRSRLLRRILTGFALVAAILSVGLAVTYARFTQFNAEFRDLLEHDVALVDDTEQLERILAEIRSNKRGYIIAGDEEFLERYHGALIATRPLVQKVRRRTLSRPFERALLERFVSALDQYASVSQPEIELRRRASRGEVPLTAVIERVSFGAGSRIADDGETSLHALHDAGFHSLEQRRREVLEVSLNSRRLAVVSMVLALLVALGYGVVVARDIGGGLAELRRAMDTMGRDDEVVLPPPPAREDEIGELARSFAEMAARLQEYEKALRGKVQEQSLTLEELRHANEALARAMRVKSDFLATMSHELRTPLNAVIGLSGFLLDSPTERLSPRARQALETMRSSGTHLLLLLNDILDMARLDAGRMGFTGEAIDPVPLVRGCVATMLPLVGDKPVELSFETDAPLSPVRADPQRFRQVLLNLLSNAVKFTDRGRVTVRARNASDGVTIEVEDTGIGISPDEQAHIFEEFHQVKAGDARPYGGTGLGLALSRRMARAMGGEITFRSERGVGSTFTVRLPRAEQAPAGVTT